MHERRVAETLSPGWTFRRVAGRDEQGFCLLIGQPSNGGAVSLSRLRIKSGRGRIQHSLGFFSFAETL